VNRAWSRPSRSPDPAAPRREGLDQEPPAERLSDELDRWFADGETRTIGELVDAFGPRSFAMSFMALMALSAMPLPTGGITNLAELVTMLLALELAAGRREVWLPDRWRRRQLTGLTGRAGRALVRRLRWIERFARPRLPGLVETEVMRRAVGLSVFGLTLAAFVAPPFPGLDTLPSIGVVTVSIGVLLRDVVVVILGLLIGSAGVAVIVGIGHAVVGLF
jgi:hypothetical protein